MRLMAVSSTVRLFIASSKSYLSHHTPWKNQYTIQGPLIISTQLFGYRITISLLLWIGTPVHPFCGTTIKFAKSLGISSCLLIFVVYSCSLFLFSLFKNQFIFYFISLFFNMPFFFSRDGSYSFLHFCIWFPSWK